MGTVSVTELLATTQGDILAGGIPKTHEDFMFFSIQKPADFVRILHLETTLDLFSTGRFIANRRAFIEAAKNAGIKDRMILAAANVSFSAPGLNKLQSVLPINSLGLTDAWKSRDKAFFGGMESDTVLQDPLGGWGPEYKGKKIDGVFLVAGSDELSVKLLCKTVLAVFGASVNVVKTENGRARDGINKGHEHFGFEDGVSQPTVAGFGPDNPKVPDGNVGELGAGWNTIPQAHFVVQDTNANQRPKWTENGSFMVYRKLEQDVGAWNKAVIDEATTRKISPALFGAKLMGRWQSGCPIMINSAKDDSSQAFANSFDYKQTPRATPGDAICPLGAHIRKMNPFRGQNMGGPFAQGRMLRRGIAYGTDFDNGKGAGDRGLHFVCYQSSIEDSFRFVQQSWANNQSFPGQGAGIDPTIGNQGAQDVSKMQVSDDDTGTKKSDFVINGINPFVKSRGGEYFFTPTLPALRNTLSMATPLNRG